MVDLSDIVSVAAAFFVVTVSPGPANVAVATVAMGSGRRDGFLFGVGLSVGLAVWGVVAATGLGALLHGATALLTVLKLGGGLYLLWLAVQSGRAALRAGDAPAAAPRRGFRHGLVLNLSNPKAVVAWMAALSMGLGAGDSALQVAVATLVCAALGFVNYTGYALAFSLPGVMAGYRRLRRSIDGLVAALFAAAGVGLIRSALAR
ncbi:LysE family translocator [Acuticoccus mangrovi]|uniref:LysE family translocator n=1 Tax=Acuticoccus mangrovi TaxID=2796142 RepID=A0A934MHN3_9HYPH|nr:LysE family translocator [Acuticoccus mangrovi]MBJ3777853.1 LysE family translocator [Acuticoccus mangrovi]